MQGPYKIDAKIDRRQARKLLCKLATDDAFRRKLETAKDPREAVQSVLGIQVTGGRYFPARITLPPKKEILHLLYAAESAVEDENRSPFGWLVLFVVFGAMPVTVQGRPAGAGARA